MEITPPKVLKVMSLNDLARFAASLTPLGATIYVIHFQHKGKHIYGILTVYRDYYKFYGVPIFYYFESEKELNGKYILIRISDKEEIEVTNGTRPGWIHIPIISLKEKPDFIELP